VQEREGGRAKIDKDRSFWSRAEGDSGDFDNFSIG
jgi:hypothetical protein